MPIFRNRKRRRGPLPFRYVLLLTTVFFIFSTVLGLWIVNTGIKPTLVSYAETQTRKISAMVISKAINNKVANVIDINEIIESGPVDSKGANTTKFNTEIINRVLAETTNLVQLNLKEAEKGNLEALELPNEVELEKVEKEGEGITFSVPLGQATNNALLGNLGPRIPIKFVSIGDVRSNVNTRVEPYGINNVFVEVSIHITVNVQIIIPFATTVTTVEQDVPVAMGYIQGEVPQFYNGEGGTSPSLQLPTNP